MPKIKTRVFAALAAAIFVFSVIPVGAAERPVLTLANAQALALENSSSYKKAQKDHEQSKKDLDDARDAIYYISETPEYVKAKCGIMRAESGVKNFPALHQAQKDGIFLEAENLFNRIVNAERGLIITDAGIAAAKGDLEISELRLKLGLVSQSAFEAEKNQYAQRVQNRKTSAASIEDLYTELNKMLGKPLADRYKITYEAVYKPIGKLDLDAKISAVLAKSPAVASAESELAIARFELDSHYDSEHSSFYNFQDGKTEDSLEFAFKQREKAVEDKKKELAATVMGDYNSIKKLETAHDANALRLEALERQLEAKEIRYKLGKATKIEVERAKHDIAALKEEIAQNERAHELAVKKFNNVYLFSGAL